MSMLFLLAMAGAAPAGSTDPLAAQAMQNFGACVVEQSPRAVQKLLAMDHTTDAYDQRLKRLSEGHGRCAAGWRIAFNGVLFAGAAAEALLEGEVAARKLPARIGFNAERPPVAARDETEAMALCTVMHAPQKTAALLATDAGTGEEIKALNALAPTLSDCLRDGVAVQVNRRGTRAILALAAWRIASSSEQAPR